MLIFYLLSCFQLVLSQQCALYSPDEIIYENNGDFTIAYIGQFTERTAEGVCKINKKASTVIQNSEVFTYAVREINRRKNLLPNVTLGFTVMDGCRESLISLSRVWTILNMKCKSGSGKGILIGLVGPLSSQQAVTMSGSLAIHKIPHVGLMTSSDELSDKTRYEYFQRLVPPDRYQTELMLDVIAHFNWSYFSVIYTEDSYGEGAYKQLTKMIRGKTICIGHSKMISRNEEIGELEEFLEEVYKNRNNRLLLLFTHDHVMKRIMNILKARNLLKHFLILASDSLCFETNGLYPPPIGMLCISFPKLQMPKFTQHYVQMDPFGEEASPWLPKAYEKFLDCSWNVSGNTRQSCQNLSLKSAISEIDMKSVAKYKVYDAVYVFANALHNYITDECPSLFKGRNDCFKADLFLKYVRNVSFTGLSGWIKFDENGDMTNGYVLQQYYLDDNGKERFEDIGSWSLDKPIGQRLNLINDIDFGFFKADEDVNNTAIKSVCSQPCKVREIYQYEENKCCWTCKKCRDYEYINNNLTECIPCPSFTWPDAEYAMTCEKIPVTTLRVFHPVGIAIVTSGSVGAGLTLLIMLIFSIKRKSKLVKASSRDLTAISLTGTLLASLSSCLFVMYPTDDICLCQKLFFHFSVTVIFSPILTKTNRVYRIFSSAKKAQIRPRFISSKAQLIITAIQILTQVVILLTTCYVNPPKAELRMPVIVEKYVEFHCKQELWAFLIPLCYNIIILMICAVFGFFTRKLPENFNETWFIFLSVAATLLMWILLLPTYFTAFYAYNRAAILAFCLLVNAFLTIACQNGTKLYGLLFIGEENMILGTFNNPTQVSHMSTNQN